MTKPQYPVPYPQPPRKSRTALWIALGVLGFFVLLCGGCAGIIADDTDNPSSATQQHLPHLSQLRLPAASSALDVRLTPITRPEPMPRRPPISPSPSPTGSAPTTWKRLRKRPEPGSAGSPPPG